MGGEVRSGKNVIIKAGRREGRRRVRAPNRGSGRRMSMARGTTNKTSRLLPPTRWASQGGIFRPVIQGKSPC